MKALGAFTGLNMDLLKEYGTFTEKISLPIGYPSSLLQRISPTFWVSSMTLLVSAFAMFSMPFCF